MTAEEKLELERRLENWSRWLRQRSKPKGKSPLYEIMVGMGFRYQESEKVDDSLEERIRRSTQQMPIDVSDAEKVQAAWQSMPEGREKRYIEEMYAFRRSGGRALRGLSYERKRLCVFWAYQMLWNRLTKYQYVV